MRSSRNGSSKTAALDQGCGGKPFISSALKGKPPRADSEAGASNGKQNERALRSRTVSDKQADSVLELTFFQAIRSRRQIYLKSKGSGNDRNVSVTMTRAFVMATAIAALPMAAAMAETTGGPSGANSSAAQGAPNSPGVYTQQAQGTSPRGATMGTVDSDGKVIPNGSIANTGAPITPGGDGSSSGSGNGGGR